VNWCLVGCKESWNLVVLVVTRGGLVLFGCKKRWTCILLDVSRGALVLCWFLGGIYCFCEGRKSRWTPVIWL
jgi:hypothetical protein